MYKIANVPADGYNKGSASSPRVNIMVIKQQRYNLSDVINDVKSFFEEDNHWARAYGSKATCCNKDSVYYKRQIQVIFEDVYPHDVVGKAVNDLIVNGFLKHEPRIFGNNVPIIFVHRKDIRYVATEIKGKLKIVEQFSADELNDGVGKYAEILFNHMFQNNQFDVIDRNATKFRNKEWKPEKIGRKKDLDFIITKDGINYGVEIKNTFKYMPQNEFEEKLNMCEYLGLLPIFPLRCPSPQQFEMMKDIGGLALEFKSHFFPPGNQKLVTSIWNHFRLPVIIWEAIPPKVKNIFLTYHSTQHD